MAIPDLPFFDFRLEGELSPPEEPIVSLYSLSGMQGELQEAARALSSNAAAYSGGVALAQLASDQVLMAQATGNRDAGKLWQLWQGCGRRSAAMAAHDWNRAFSEFRARLRKDPAWWGRVDAQALKAIGSQFRTAFPDAERFRDSVAHPETYIGPRNAVGAEVGEDLLPFIEIGTDARVTVRNLMNDGVLTTTFDGKVYKCPITFEAAALISNLTRRIYDEYVKLDDRGKR